MKIVRQNTTDVWNSGLFIGDSRPMGRITIQKAELKHYVTQKGRWGSPNFLQINPEVELPNIKSIVIDRRVDQDSATCEIVLYNTRPKGIADPVSKSGQMDQPGYYTFNRGGSVYSSRWGVTSNQWKDYLVPNRVIRTYQGYGLTAAVEPNVDPLLDLTGTWLIDTVVSTTDKLITVRCRDFAKMLIEQIAHPPVIPLAQYPISFESIHEVPFKAPAGAGTTTPAKSSSGAGTPPSSKMVNLPINYSADSGFPYVGAGGAVYGHYGKHAFDGNDHTFWLSIGNPAGDGFAGTARGYAFEWVEGSVGGNTVKEVIVHPFKGNYHVYVSVMVGGQWISHQAGDVIPYGPNATPVVANPPARNGDNIAFYEQASCAYEKPCIIQLGSPGSGKDNGHGVANVQKIRVTFTRLTLYDGSYRAGVRSLQVRGFKKTTATTPTGHAAAATGSPAPKPTIKVGNYSDYTDIVKYLCAVGGFYWPPTASPPPQARAEHPTVGIGSIWGDFETSNTSGPAAIPSSVFDKRPLIDGITYVRDILNYVFFVDEGGAAIFRSPNFWQIGNYISSTAKGLSTKTTPVNYVIDSVVRADAPALRTAETGQLWHQAGPGYDLGAAWAVRANHAQRVGPKRSFRPTSTPFTWQGDPYALYATVDVSADVDYNARVTTLTQPDSPTPANSNPNHAHLVMRWLGGPESNHAAGNGIIVSIGPGAPGRFIIYSVRKGVATVISNGFTGTTAVPLLGDYDVRVNLIGTVLKLYINGTLVKTLSDGRLLYHTATSQDGYKHAGRSTGILGDYSNVTYSQFAFYPQDVTAGAQTVDFTGRTSSVITIDERKHIKNVTVTLDDKSQRSRIFIANAGSDVGATVDAQEPFPMGMERVAIWTDQHFGNKQECLVMADLIALQYRFKQRTLSVTISGNPSIQPDDQVRIFEEVTAETNYQYVNGVNSSMDLERGTWDMTLDCHWLGESPDNGGSWGVVLADLQPETREFLASLGKLYNPTSGQVI